MASHASPPSNQLEDGCRPKSHVFQSRSLPCVAVCSQTFVFQAFIHVPSLAQNVNVGLCAGPYKVTFTSMEIFSASEINVRNSQVAVRYNSDVHSVKRANNLISDHALASRQRVFVPGALPNIRCVCSSHHDVSPFDQMLQCLPLAVPVCNVTQCSATQSTMRRTVLAGQSPSSGAQSCAASMLSLTPAPMPPALPTLGRRPSRTTTLLWRSSLTCSAVVRQITAPDEDWKRNRSKHALVHLDCALIGVA